ncbi:hypothetical protein [Hydrogenimonas cancrithermarum]|uniref:Lipoprotein n=1 Tax=Hydrogenimonas cancrithermarum TaxID=2993563 RepID=A0ABN6WYT6_9BACT|nr:hypothetical protein [Hydrogenimonas cancrithermarum]BDY13327.1 hypothetical protein HCR_16390 [Hydrogenimonas cancrithermarum]
MKKIVFSALSIMLFVGCASTQTWLKTKPVPFQEGYEAGCVSGEERAGYTFSTLKKNEIRYENDPLYKEGWDEGYSRCFSDKEVEICMRRPGAF